jgi:hypothetical protein
LITAPPAFPLLQVRVHGELEEVPPPPSTPSTPPETPPRSRTPTPPPGYGVLTPTESVRVRVEGPPYLASVYCPLAVPETPVEYCCCGKKGPDVPIREAKRDEPGGRDDLDHGFPPRLPPPPRVPRPKLPPPPPPPPPPGRRKADCLDLSYHLGMHARVPPYRLCVCGTCAMCRGPRLPPHRLAPHGGGGGGGGRGSGGGGGEGSRSETGAVETSWSIPHTQLHVTRAVIEAERGGCKCEKVVEKVVEKVEKKVKRPPTPPPER